MSQEAQALPLPSRSDNGVASEAQAKATEVAEQAQEKAKQAAGQKQDKLREQLDQRSSQAATQISEHSPSARLHHSPMPFPGLSLTSATASWAVSLAVSV
jgi:hypothetical protein